MRLTIRHTSHYTYSEPVRYGLLQVRLEPKPRNSQTVIDWAVTLEHAKQEARFDDEYNNHVMLIRSEEGATEIDISCVGTVETINQNGIIGEHRGPMPLWYFSRRTDLTRPGPGVRALLRDLENRDDDLDRLHDLSLAVSGAIRYETGHTDSTSNAEDALQAGHGVCQDHAHVFISAARELGFPARYVSGYLLMNDRIEQDATHAWAEVHIPALGWVGFDISNGISPDERYVATATALDYRGAAPIRGLAFGDHAEELAVRVEVQQQ